MAKNAKRIGVLVVAYNAASTLAKTLDRIPDDVRGDIEEVIVSDDHSQDSTYLVGLGYQQVSELPITLIRQTTNLGYGGNQKAGYNLAIEHGLDIVVMLHGDGQYAPESMPDLLGPLLSGEADAVFGSRIMIKGAAREGGMPMYKPAFYCNRTISTYLDLQALNKSNVLLKLEEWDGRPVMTFRGIPIRTCDAILSTEARVV